MKASPYFRAVIAVAVVLVSCQTAVPVKKASTEDLADRFYETNRALLDQGQDSRLFLNLYAAADAYPDRSKTLLELYFLREQSRFQAALRAEDYFEAQFHLNNLAAFGDRSKVAWYSGITALRNLARSKGYFVSLGEATAESPLASITDFNQYLAEILVTRTYRIPDGIDRKQSDYGSGFLIDSKHVVTNYHVVEPGLWSSTTQYTVEVSIDRGPRKPATLLAWDSINDLALLSLSEPIAQRIPFAETLGNSENLKQGDAIYTLGQHSGFVQTMTKGIVSAPTRKAPESGNWIQIDAALSPGASGGLAIGEDRKIYGVNVAGIMGIGINFIIPIKTVLGSLDSLVQGKNPAYPWLGAFFTNEVKGEVRFLDLFPSSPLQPLGIQEGDRLVAINGLKIAAIVEAQNYLMTLMAGNLVQLEIEKESDKSRKTLYVVLPRRPDRPVYTVNRGDNRSDSLYAYFGFALSKTTTRNISFSMQGVGWNVNLRNVEKVQKNTYPERMGIQPGDEIGMIEDSYERTTRTIYFLHVPKGKNFNSLKNPGDFLFSMEKDPYDETLF